MNAIPYLVVLYLNSDVRIKILSTSDIPIGKDLTYLPNVFQQREIFIQRPACAIRLSTRCYRLTRATGLYLVNVKTNPVDIAILYKLCFAVITILLSKRWSIINESASFTCSPGRNLLPLFLRNPTCRYLFRSLMLMQMKRELRRILITRVHQWDAGKITHSK